MANKFKIGDLIRGTRNGMYAVTDEEMARGKVTIVYDNDNIEVEILEHKNQSRVGEKYDVESKYFELINFELSDLQFADVLTLRNCERYVYADDVMRGEKLDYNSDGNTISCWYNDDLTQNEGDRSEDIVKVERNGQVIYERQEAIEMTVEEICEKLGYEVKIVKEK